MSTVAVIGKSIVIKGELSGNEDLTVEGTVDGKITLTDNNLVIGEEGRVNANLFARMVTITGKVEGDVVASERVEISESGSLKGNIRSPRLVINDGAFFQGSIEMQKPGMSDTPVNKPKIQEKPSSSTPAKPVAEMV
ncbi:MAG: polymer-forming cytoskeletal protein [Leptospirillia bacterium]